jgi:DNA-binding transcriptional LysR family regulator
MPRREQGVPPGATLPDLEDLRVLCAVVDEGGVNSAARKLGQPRSSVSRRLTRLEGRLGARLFHRSHQELTLTPEGVRLTERARRLIDDAETLVRDARGVASEVRGRLRVSAPLDLAEDRAFWTTAFTAHPEVTFEIELTNRYVDVVREGSWSGAWGVTPCARWRALRTCERTASRARRPSCAHTAASCSRRSPGAPIDRGQALLTGTSS